MVEIHTILMVFWKIIFFKNFVRQICLQLRLVLLGLALLAGALLAILILRRFRLLLVLRGGLLLILRRLGLLFVLGRRFLHLAGGFLGLRLRGAFHLGAKQFELGEM